jgi:hypothetical protein
MLKVTPCITFLDLNPSPHPPGKCWLTRAPWVRLYFIEVKSLIRLSNPVRVQIRDVRIGSSVSKFPAAWYEQPGRKRLPLQLLNKPRFMNNLNYAYLAICLPFQEVPLAAVG